MSDLAEDPKETAGRLGLEVIEPGPHDLFIDIDDAPSQDFMGEMMSVLGDNDFGVYLDKITFSKSGNRHAYLKFDRELTPLERVCLQACLGSDRKRELLSLIRIWQTERTPTVFFEVPSGEAKTAAPEIYEADDICHIFDAA